MRGCNIPSKRGAIPCGKATTFIVLTTDRRLEHRCTKHAKLDDVKDKKTYAQWRKM